MNKLLTKNVLFSIVNLLITASIVAIQYKIVIQELGLELLGLWSLIMSISTIIQIGNGSASGTMIKFTSECISNDDEDSIQYYLNSTLTLSSLFWFFLSIGIYTLFYFFSNKIITDKNLVGLGTLLLPLTFINLLLNIIAQIFFSVLEGYKLTYVKNIINIFIMLIMLPITIFSIYKYGLVGLVLSQITQNLLLVIIGIYKVSYKIKYSLIGFSKRIYYKKALDYNVQMQVAMLFRLMYEPIFKIFLANNMSLESVGLFEIINKIATYARTVFNVALYNLIPYITEYSTKKEIHKKLIVFSKISTITSISMSAILTLLLSSTFIVNAHLNIKNKNEFMSYMLIVSVGTIINGYSVAPYYFDFATGYLKSIIRMYIIMTAYLCIISLLIMSIFPGLSVIWAWFVSMSAGSIYLVYDYHIRNNLNIRRYYDKKNAVTISLIIAAFLITNSDLIFLIPEFIKSIIVFIIGNSLIWFFFKKEIFNLLLIYKK